MRTNYCGLIDKRYLGQFVTVQGWVHRRRDHGGIIFIDLRDREGIVQVVIDPDTPDAFSKADASRSEYVLQVMGQVRLRPEGTVNDHLISGEIEILAQEIMLLNTAEPPPFQIDDTQISESVRLTHRAIDLRRPVMQSNMRLRHRVSMLVRNYLDQQGFIDVETPALTRSTPEGAREYLVPSRIHQGLFFALPQSPQIFKQLLMVAGFDRYYQIARCFRDEDLRVDRQPEFTQIDIEASFIDENEMMRLAEEMVNHLFKKELGIDLGEFPHITYDQAIALYGSDKPDLRVTLTLTELTDIMKTVPFKVFSEAACKQTGRVVALRVPDGASFSRSEIDTWTQFVGIYGAKGLAYIKVNDPTEPNETGLQSPIVKNLTRSVLETILARTGAQKGDILFFGADEANIVNEAMGALRQKIGHEKGKAAGYFKAAWKPCWIIDFPLFEYSKEDRRWVACHHPFTSPKLEDLVYLQTNPGACRARAYDLVLNGWEIGGGSMRIHSAEVQSAVFDALGLGLEEAQNKFGFLLDNLKLGAPPHGGIALGLDRLVTLMAGAESIRDVIAFPKTQRAQCLLTAAPNRVHEKQLRALHIRLRHSTEHQS